MHIKKINGYQSLCSDNFYTNGEKIYKLCGEVLNEPTRTSIEVAKSQHIEDKYGMFMNHSFKPNTQIRDGYIVAITFIHPGDELTFNYNKNESSMACPFYDKSTGQYVKGKRDSIEIA